jgi:hypothetical protein
MTNPAPIPFHVAYSAPWRIQAHDVVDADGDVVTTFDADDADEVVFWQGIIDAVNASARLERALRHARAM